VAQARHRSDGRDGRARAALGAAARGAATLAATLLGLLAVTFLLSALSPIDPALQRVGDHASESAYRQARAELGLDLPLPQRFGRYLVDLAHGDLGVSRATGEPVRDDLERVFPATIELATLALAVSTLVGLALGLLAALRPGGLLDALVRLVSLFGNSVPVFWLGLLALYYFYAHLHWAGGPGRLDDAYEYTLDRVSGFVLVDTWRSGVPGAFQNALAHLALPVLALAANAVGNIARMARAALLGEVGREYATLARAKGASDARVLLAHALPNVAGVLVTVVALTYASLLEGAVLTETVFAWPGLGRYLTNALFAADLPAILGATLVIGVSFVLLNRLADLLARRVDPRAT
jgi:peptide/nickel transport system permease protein